MNRRCTGMYNGVGEYGFSIDAKQWEKGYGVSLN